MTNHINRFTIRPSTEGLFIVVDNKYGGIRAAGPFSSSSDARDRALELNAMEVE